MESGNVQIVERMEENVSEFNFEIENFEAISKNFRLECKVGGDYSGNISCSVSIYNSPAWINFNLKFSARQSPDDLIRAFIKIYQIDGNKNKNNLATRNVAIHDGTRLTAKMSLPKEYLNTSNEFKNVNGKFEVGAIIKFTLINQSLIDMFGERSNMANQIFHERLYADVIIKFKGEEIKGHKIILVQSGKLCTLISNLESSNMLELQDDVSIEAMKGMIDFIYFDKIEVEVMRQQNKDLWKLARKYQVPRLENYCVRYYNEKLNSGGVLEVLAIVGELEGIAELKKKCMELIKRNIRQITEKDDWKAFANQHPNVFGEIFKFILPAHQLPEKVCAELEKTKVTRETAKREYYGTILTDRRSNGDYRKKFERLFLSGKMSDFTVEVDGNILKAHKLVLSTQCEYFDEMFSSESSENRLVISEYKVESVYELLRFIYCEKVENIEQHSFELVQLAHKFKLLDLKKKCEKILEGKITHENFVEIFGIGVLNECRSLITEASIFLIKNYVTISEMSAWNEFVISHVDILNEMFREWIKLIN